MLEWKRIVYLYIHCRLRSMFQDLRLGLPFCISQARNSIYNIICRGIYIMYNLRWWSDCWYLWNCWLSLLKLFFYRVDMNKMIDSSLFPSYVLQLLIDFIYRRIHVPFLQILLLYVKHHHMHRLILKDVSDQ